MGGKPLGWKNESKLYISYYSLKTVLIIDDEEKLRNLLARIISLEGFEVLHAPDFKTAMKRLEQSEIDIVLCDVKLPDGNGVEVSKKIKDKYASLEIILLTAYGNIADGVQAIKNGVFDYITKGDDNNRIIPLLYKASEKVELNKKVQRLEKKLESRNSFETIIGKSPAIVQAIELSKKVSETDTTVLLTGETGTGKEVFAQAIHQASHRSKNSFVAINCSAFSKDLLENEMFGHKAGAFTGAAKDQKGLFEEAHKGTIFLDEIGEMALDLQAKLLRVLETGEFFKVGDSKPVKVDVRIVAATNRNLLEEIKKGTFRDDLYYRISVFQIKLPALRERIPDIELLVSYFVSLYAGKMNKRITGVSKAYSQALVHHNWNGNIRELRNIIERSIILTSNNELGTESLPLELQNTSKSITSKGKEFSGFELASAEKLHIQKVMNYVNGNKTEAARLLNIALTTLYRKLEEYGIA